MRIAFVIPSLGPGGAERVASILCSFWTQQGQTITLVMFEAEGTPPFYPLHEAISLRYLDACGGQRSVLTRLTSNIRRVLRLRSLVRALHPDVVVAFTTEANVVSLCACLGLGVPVVISERNQPDRTGLGKLNKIARSMTYAFATTIVMQTEPIATWARARFRVPVAIIPNPVLLKHTEPPHGDRLSAARHARKRIISVGRLAHQKGFDILIRSFAGLAAKHPDWRLVIYGEGPERAALEQLRAESGLAGRIALPGTTKDIEAAFYEASLFVLPSRFEGYPNALLEALASGLPVIATACPGATAEILGEDFHGVLVPPEDVAAMTAALDAMMSEPERRDAYASRARDAIAQLDVAIIGKRWLDLLAKAARRVNG